MIKSYLIIDTNNRLITELKEKNKYHIYKQQRDYIIELYELCKKLNRKDCNQIFIEEQLKLLNLLSRYVKVDKIINKLKSELKNYQVDKKHTHINLTLENINFNKEDIKGIYIKLNNGNIINIKRDQINLIP